MLNYYTGTVYLQPSNNSIGLNRLSEVLNNFESDSGSVILEENVAENWLPLIFLNSSETVAARGCSIFYEGFLCGQLRIEIYFRGDNDNGVTFFKEMCDLLGFDGVLIGTDNNGVDYSETLICDSNRYYPDVLKSNDNTIKPESTFAKSKVNNLNLVDEFKYRLAPFENSTGVQWNFTHEKVFIGTECYTVELLRAGAEVEAALFICAVESYQQQDLLSNLLQEKLDKVFPLLESYLANDAAERLSIYGVFDWFVSKLGCVKLEYETVKRDNSSEDSVSRYYLIVLALACVLRLFNFNFTIG